MTQFSNINAAARWLLVWWVWNQQLLAWCVRADCSCWWCGYWQGSGLKILSLLTEVGYLVSNCLYLCWCLLLSVIRLQGLQSRLHSCLPTMHLVIVVFTPCCIVCITDLWCLLSNSLFWIGNMHVFDLD